MFRHRDAKSLGLLWPLRAIRAAENDALGGGAGRPSPGRDSLGGRCGRSR